MVKTVDAATLKQWLAKKSVVLVDVREPQEYALERIKGAQLIPLGDIPSALEGIEVPAGKKLVFQCKSGMRSGAACQQAMGSRDEVDSYNLEGGIEAWKRENLPILGGNAKGGSDGLSIIRQVQLTVGGVVLVSSVLSIAGVSGFAYVAAAAGAGLTFAGLSGNCMLAMILRKLPGNASRPMI